MVEKLTIGNEAQKHINAYVEYYKYHIELEYES